MPKAEPTLSDLLKKIEEVSKNTTETSKDLKLVNKELKTLSFNVDRWFKQVNDRIDHYVDTSSRAMSFSIGMAKLLSTDDPDEKNRILKKITDLMNQSEKEYFNSF